MHGYKHGLNAMLSQAFDLMRYCTVVRPIDFVGAKRFVIFLKIRIARYNDAITELEKGPWQSTAVIPRLSANRLVSSPAPISHAKWQRRAARSSPIVPRDEGKRRLAWSHTSRTEATASGFCSANAAGSSELSKVSSGRGFSVPSVGIVYLAGYISIGVYRIVHRRVTASSHRSSPTLPQHNLLNLSAKHVARLYRTQPTVQPSQPMWVGRYKSPAQTQSLAHLAYPILP